MATKNIRVVSYLPPPYREKLREYMQAQSLTESAALVLIVKQFFDGTTGTKSANTDNWLRVLYVIERKYSTAR